MKQQEWDERCKPHAQEIEAISDTINMLNSDDALELFKVIAQELEVNYKKYVMEVMKFGKVSPPEKIADCGLSAWTSGDSHRKGHRRHRSP